MSCHTWLDRREAQQEKLIPARDFKELADNLKKIPTSLSGNPSFSGQVILLGAASSSLSEIHENEHFLSRLGVTVMAEYSRVGPSSQQAYRQAYLVIGTSQSLDRLLTADFTPLAQGGREIFLDLISIPYIDPTFLKILRQVDVDLDLAAQLTPTHLPIPEVTTFTDPSIIEEFGNPTTGSFREFSRRFANFTDSEMAPKIFTFLSSYLRVARRPEFLSKITELEFKKTTTAMAANLSAKPLGQILSGLRIFAAMSQLDRPDGDIARVGSVHKQGVVGAFFDSLGIPPKVKEIELPPQTEVPTLSSTPEPASATNRRSQHLEHQEIFLRIAELRSQSSELATYFTSMNATTTGLGEDKKKLVEFNLSLDYLEQIEPDQDLKTLHGMINELESSLSDLASRYLSHDERHVLDISQPIQDANLLQPGWQYLASNHEGVPLRAIFAESPIKTLKRRYTQLIPKFLEAIRLGVVAARGVEGIKFAADIPEGTRGRTFEVKILGRGHFRLIGCMKDGLFQILRFDPDAPQTRDGWNKKYLNLCQ